MTLYNNKYRIESARFKNWDYSFNGHYFITICVKNRECLFGDVLDGEMVLSEIGEIAFKYWNEIAGHFSFVTLDAFVVMPNHIHGIILIDREIDYRIVDGDAQIGRLYQRANGQCRDQTIEKNPHWKPGNLGVIVNQYKRICTITIRKIKPDFAWQSRFHDIIVRNNNDLQRIRKYIENNPANWVNDNNYFFNAGQ